MKPMNIYMCGVGGQGIGMFADVLAKSCIAAGYRVRGCDTHGLAQRHGTVISHLRIGQELFTPRVPLGRADLIVGLERLEAIRAAGTMLKQGGVLIYYDAIYQPMHVRTGKAKYPKPEELQSIIDKRKAALHRVFIEDLTDPRMQNAALLGKLASVNAIEGVTDQVIEAALRNTLPSKVLNENITVFQKIASSK